MRKKRKNIVKKPTEFTISQAAANIMIEARAYQTLIDTFSRLPFCFRLSYKASVKCEEKRFAFWQKVYEENPEARGLRLRYYPADSMVRVRE